MGLAQQNNLDRIIDMLSWLKSQVELSNKLNLTDINNHAEDFYCGLVNLIFDWELSNLNGELEANFPAIDLGDANQKIAVQVTSTSSLKKVKYTVEKYVEKEFHEQYDRLIVLRIGKHVKHRGSHVGDEASYQLSIADDIWGVETLLATIKSLDTQKIARIREFLENEITVGGAKKTIEVASKPLSLFPTNLIDGEIDRELSKLRKIRFFVGSNISQVSSNFADRLTSGDLSLGSKEICECAMLWCARFLAASNIEKSKYLLEKASAQSLTEEYKIASAFVRKHSNDQADALMSISGLDSPLANTARLLLSSKSNDAQEMLEWVGECGYDVSHFDGAGKFNYFKICLDSQNWEKAIQSLPKITDTDLEECPVLFFIQAIVNLIQVVPIHYRSQVIQVVPFYLRSFPIKTQQINLEQLEKASSCFSECKVIAAGFGLDDAKNVAEEYELWVDLRNPNREKTAIETLERYLQQPNKSLRYANFALQFGVDIDTSILDQRIDQEIARSGQISSAGAIARFALIAKQETRQDALDYLSAHKENLLKVILPTTIAMLEIDLLSQEGRAVEAEEVLTELKGLTKDEDLVSIGQGLIDGISKKDFVGVRIKAYEQTKSLDTLNNLTKLLEDQKNWKQLAKYARELHSQFGTVETLERLSFALMNLGKTDDAIRLLDANPVLVSQSFDLKNAYSKALYISGEIHKSEEVISELLREEDSKPLRELRINIAIASGNWTKLAGFIEYEWEQRHSRDASELTRAAQLAHAASSTRAKEFLIEATSKNSDDPNIYLAAYQISTSEGWEEDGCTVDWLPKAIELSNDDGPIQMMSLQDLLDRSPDWQDRKNDTFENIKKAKIPMFVAADQLNRSLSEMMLVQALVNQDESDARKKSIIRTYSPKRQEVVVEARSVGIDATALLTLAMLGGLEQLEAAFQTIFIPHSTLFWLLEEKRRVIFHQPSRLKRANALSRLLSDGSLSKFVQSGKPSSNLSNEVGASLASFLEAASRQRGETHPHIIIQPGTIHKAGSLTSEPADVSQYKDLLFSCSDVISFLNKNGYLTEKETSKAYDFLKSQGDTGCSSEEIQLQSTLYLADVAVSYFQSLGILGKLKKSGLTAYISNHEFFEMESLLQYENYSADALRIIESLRSFLAAGIEKAKIKIGPRPYDLDDELNQFRLHPSISVMDLVPKVEAIISDDPFLNRHSNITGEFAPLPIYTTFDCLEYYETEGYASASEVSELKTKLRTSGYSATNITSDELSKLLTKTTILEGKMVETTELKALRSNLLQMQIYAALDMPDDFAFLMKLHKAVRICLIDQWNSKTNVDVIKPRSEWLLSLMKLSHWAACYPFEIGSNIARVSIGSDVHILMSAGLIEDKKRKSEYCEWLESFVIEPFQQTHPDLYNDMMVAIEKILINTASKPYEEFNDDES